MWYNSQNISLKKWIENMIFDMICVWFTHRPIIFENQKQINKFKIYSKKNEHATESVQNGSKPHAKEEANDDDDDDDEDYEENATLFVKNLNFDTTEESLQKVTR